jgi:hypothetical protein
MWAYSGTRRFLDDSVFASWSVTDNLSTAFPPALITVGNADPLRPHSDLLVEKLRAQGVEPETLSPTITSRRSATSTSSISTRRKVGSSSNECSRSCGDGLR